MSLDPASNFARAALASGITSGATSLTLVSGGGAKFAAGGFNAVIYNSTDYSDPSDDPSVEVVRVGTISGDTLPITRAQESTSAVAHNTAGKTYTLVAGPLASLLSQIDSTYAAKATTLSGYGITDALGLHATADAAAKWSSARNLAGNSVDGSGNVAFANKFIVQGTADAGLSSAQFLGALGTGILKSTTTTGILSIAVAGDFPTLNQDTTGTASKAAITDASFISFTFYLTGVNSAAGGSLGLNSSSQISCNMGTGLLSATSFAGAGTGLTGTAASLTAGAATVLATARAINGVNFDGSAPITITAAAGTLTGSTLAAGVTTSSLTSVGTLGSLTVTGALTADSPTLCVDATNHRVGIGTAAPGKKLEVVGTAYLHTGISDVAIQVDDSDAMRLPSASTSAVFYMDFPNLRFRDPSHSYATTMFIASGGNVGIGTTAPGTRLEVNGAASAAPATSGSTISAGAKIRLRTTTGTGVLDFGTNGASGGWIQSTDASNYATNYALSLNPNGGNVGIGTAAPGYALDVNGACSATSFSGAGTGITGTASSLTAGAAVQTTMYDDTSTNATFYLLMTNTAPSGGGDNRATYTSSTKLKFNPSTGALSVVALTITTPPAFASGDKYLVINSSGVVHKSALGPAS